MTTKLTTCSTENGFEVILSSVGIKKKNSEKGKIMCKEIPFFCFEYKIFVHYFETFKINIKKKRIYKVKYIKFCLKLAVGSNYVLKL